MTDRLFWTFAIIAAIAALLCILLDVDPVPMWTTRTLAQVAGGACILAMAALVVIGVRSWR